MRSAALDGFSVAEVMSRWPATVGVFLSHRMHCIGCPISPFHTLVEAAKEHELSLEDLMDAVTAEIDSSPNAGRTRQSIRLSVGSRDSSRLPKLPAD